MTKDTPTSHLPKEQSVYGKWENGYSFPYQNSITGIYYARDIGNALILPNSARSLQCCTALISDMMSQLSGTVR